MKPVKEKKEKESFWNALLIYGFIAISLIGFLGYAWGSVAIFTAFILPPLFFKNTQPSPSDNMFSQSPTDRIKNAWNSADKKKKAGIVIGLIALLPFFILGVIWLAMIGAMFFVDLLFILPIILIILWLWFRNPEHQTFSGASSLGHPAILGIAVVMLLVIGMVASMNYMELHKYDGLEANDVITGMEKPSDLYYKDTDGDNITDLKDDDIDGDNITNEYDLDVDGDGYIDNTNLLKNYNTYNDTIKQLIIEQFYNIPEENRGYIDPDVVFGEEDFIVDNGTIKPKKYDVVVKVYDPFADEVFPLQRTVNLVTVAHTFAGDIVSYNETIEKRKTVDINLNETTSGYLNYADKDSPSVVFNSINLPIGTKSRGTPVANVWVVLSSKPAQKKFENEKTGLAVWSQTTDANGMVLIKNLEANVYHIRVEGAGYLPFETDITVTNKSKEFTVLIYPSYVRVPVYFKAYDDFDSASGGKILWFGGATLKADDSILYSVAFGNIHAYTKEEYENIYRQNNMYGWSGIPNIVVTPSMRTNKMFQSMFNSMMNGLGIIGIEQKSITKQFLNADIQFYAMYEQGSEKGTKPRFAESILIKGNNYITQKQAMLEYVVWPKGQLSGINGVTLTLSVVGKAYFKVTESEVNINFSWLFTGGKVKNDIAEIPISIGTDVPLTAKDYEIMYQV